MLLKDCILPFNPQLYTWLHCGKVTRQRILVNQLWREGLCDRSQPCPCRLVYLNSTNISSTQGGTRPVFAQPDKNFGGIGGNTEKLAQKKTQLLSGQAELTFHLLKWRGGCGEGSGDSLTAVPIGSWGSLRWSPRAGTRSGGAGERFAAPAERQRPEGARGRDPTRRGGRTGPGPHMTVRGPNPGRLLSPGAQSRSGTTEMRAGAEGRWRRRVARALLLLPLLLAAWQPPPRGARAQSPAADAGRSRELSPQRLPLRGSAAGASLLPPRRLQRFSWGCPGAYEADKPFLRERAPPKAARVWSTRRSAAWELRGMGKCNALVLTFQKTGRTVSSPLHRSFLRDFLHHRRERMEESLSIS